MKSESKQDVANDIHIVPVFEGEPIHDESLSCWCEPKIIDVNCETGVMIVSHNRPE